MLSTGLAKICVYTYTHTHTHTHTHMHAHTHTHTHTHTHKQLCLGRDKNQNPPPLTHCPGMSTRVQGIFLRHSQEMTASKLATKYCSSVFRPDGSSVRVLVPEVRGHTGRVWIHTAL